MNKIPFRLRLRWGVWLDRHFIPTVLAKLFCLGFLCNPWTFWYQKNCLFNTFSKMYNITRFIWKNWMKTRLFAKENIKSNQNLMQWKMALYLWHQISQTFFRWWPIFLHYWNHQNVRVLISQTNVGNTICFGPVKPKMQWRIQWSQISRKSNNFSQILFSNLLIRKTKKQILMKIGVCMGLHLYTKNNNSPAIFLEKFTSEYVVKSYFLVCWQNYEVFVFSINFFFFQECV